MSLATPAFFDVEKPCISGYVVLEQIGEGAFATVFRAVCNSTGRLLALKSLQILPNHASAEASWQREVAALQAVHSCNVVSLIAHRGRNEKGEPPLLLLEYCRVDLAALLKAARPCLLEAAAKCIMRQVLSGLAACHRAGIVHGDVKPSNILLTQGGQVKLADFGQACRMGVVMPAGRAAPAATRWYRPPEQLLGARVHTAGMDLWAAGCTLAEMLGSRPLFAGDSDIEQLSKIVEVMGCISMDSWPTAAQECPDLCKVNFPPSSPVPFEHTFPTVSAPTLQLLLVLLQYEPGRRSDATSLIRHACFSSQPLPLKDKELSDYIHMSLRGQAHPQ